jgi:hypothetical protein
MKVKDLLTEIKANQKKYKDFLEWDVYAEQISTSCKKNLKQQEKKYNKRFVIKDNENWEYFKCDGFNTLFNEEKIFTVNVNF